MKVQVVLGFLTLLSIGADALHSLTNTDKWKQLRADVDRGSSYRKDNSPIRVEFQPIRQDKGLVPGEPVHLTGSVTALIDVPQLQVRWNIPTDVHVLSGRVEDQMYGLMAGETRDVDLTVAFDSIDNQQVHLHAYFDSHGESMGSVAQFSVRAEARPRLLEQTGSEKTSGLDTLADTRKRKLVQ